MNNYDELEKLGLERFEVLKDDIKSIPVLDWLHEISEIVIQLIKTKEDELNKIARKVLKEGDIIACSDENGHSVAAEIIDMKKGNKNIHIRTIVSAEGQNLDWLLPPRICSKIDKAQLEQIKTEHQNGK